MCMYVGILYPSSASVCAHMILCIIIPNMLETESGGDDGEDGTWYAYTFITLGRKAQGCQVL